MTTPATREEVVERLIEALDRLAIKRRECIAIAGDLGSYEIRRIDRAPSTTATHKKVTA